MAYSLGGIGRDMTYTLVATFFMTYIQFAVGLSVAQFSVIGILLIAGRIWDAVNDRLWEQLLKTQEANGVIQTMDLDWSRFYSNCYYYNVQLATCWK